MANNKLLEALKNKGTGELQGFCMTALKTPLEETITRGRNKIFLQMTSRMRILGGYLIRRKGYRTVENRTGPGKYEIKGDIRIEYGIFATITILFDSSEYFGTYTIRLANKNAVMIS